MKSILIALGLTGLTVAVLLITAASSAADDDNLLDTEGSRRSLD